MARLGDTGSTVDEGQMLLHDPVDYIASKVTDRQSRVNENVRQIARREAWEVVLVAYVLWRLFK